MKKIISLALAALMLFSMIPTVSATETYNNPDENTQMGTDVVITGERTTVNDDGSASYNAEYTVTIPAKLIPGVNQTASGTVTLEGYWPSNATVTVTAEEKVKVVNNINNADEKELAITFAAIVKAGDNDGKVTASETVTVAGVDAALFGSWEGVFNYNVEYNGEAGGSGTVTPAPEQPSDPDNGDDGEQASLVTITIDDVEYQYELGTTWEQWVNSEYNTDGFLIANATHTSGSTHRLVVNASKEYYVAHTHSPAVKAEDVVTTTGTNSEITYILANNYFTIE